MIRQILKENWQMRRAGDKAARPAVVPGTVYTDLLRNGEMENPFWKDNEIRALPLMEEDYEYETVFDAEAELFSQDKVLLHRHHRRYILKRKVHRKGGQYAPCLGV